MDLSFDGNVVVRKRCLEPATQQEPNPPKKQRPNVPDCINVVKDNLNDEHCKKCKRGRGCSRCSWVRKKKIIERGTRMNHAITNAELQGLTTTGRVLANTSWCEDAIVDGVWGLGCAACSELPPDRTAGSKLRLWAQYRACRKQVAGWMLARHARSRLHREAVAHLLGVNRGPTGGTVSGAPTLAEFKELLLRMEEGETERGTARRQCHTKCVSTKAKRMRWAVIEAMREKDREFLRKATSIVLARDERKSRLLVRFSSCDGRLNVRRGFMGQTRGAGGKALQLLHATKKVLKDFCTKRLGVPGNKQATLDEALYKHVRSKIEVIVSDSASNEILAANVGRGRRLETMDAGNPPLDGDPAGRRRQPLGSLTPNLIIIGRDLAHGFRRTARHVCASHVRICLSTSKHQSSRGSYNAHMKRTPTWIPS